ncbi:hypothetical protein [Flavisphingomonas formosensis]|uniref:hypothetical protein n=1 Tax=Flavisphingomonas formosensis TaxID=861534 RepID=UPI0012F9A3EB|nr:hypothetical protein [Sphingomonas formosensis]
MTRHFSYDERWNGVAIPAEHWHFHRRLLDRYGVVLGPGDFSNMMDGLRSGKALLIREKGKGRALYQWRVKSTAELIFIVAGRNKVFTAYPPNASLRKLAKRLHAERKALRKARGTEPNTAPAGEPEMAARCP